MSRLRRALRRYGIELPFTQVICPEHVKAIRFDEDWRVEVTVRRTLVFLERPEPADLHDVIPVDRNDFDSVIGESPDAAHVGRVPCRGGTRVYWKPREPIVPNALYVHQIGWQSAPAGEHAALYTELHCDVRTGIAALEVDTPVPIEWAVAFKQPRWRRLQSERGLVKYALSRPPDARDGVITRDGQRVEWRIEAPAAGDRYLCVMFTSEGADQWPARLQETSLSGRVKRLVQSVMPT